MSRKGKAREQPRALGNWQAEEALNRRRRIRRARLGATAFIVILAVTAWLFTRALTAPAPDVATSEYPPVAPERATAQGAARQGPPPTGPAERADADIARDRILTCTAPDGSTFYTNAATCADADLDNRVTVVVSRPADGVQDGAVGRNCVDSSRKGVASNRFLAACQEPFMKALELERFLALADDPVESVRAEEYCALIAQGVNAGCMATNAQFCFLRVCQQRLER